MNQVTVTADLRSQLHGLDSDLEFRDESGRMLGYFVPVPEVTGVEPWMYQWAKAQFGEEELERARRQPGGRTTAEVLRRLEQS